MNKCTEYTAIRTKLNMLHTIVKASSEYQVMKIKQFLTKTKIKNNWSIYNIILSIILNFYIYFECAKIKIKNTKIYFILNNIHKQ